MFLLNVVGTGGRVIPHQSQSVVYICHGDGVEDVGHVKLIFCADALG
jgi:hypothetical protein